MKPYQIYRQQQSVGATRIDLLLMLYDKTICRLQQAQQAWAQQDRVTATARLLQAQTIVQVLMTGVDLQYGEIPQNLLRLYEYVLHCLHRNEAGNVQDALHVLTILREGLSAIQPQARSLEWSGEIPSLTRERTFQFSA
jgi:flagellar protein FliS